MNFDDFRSRAIEEGLRYGEDRLVFLRELAQNSRDAGATNINVTASMDGDELMLEFADDGDGMSFVDARDYLFTLYASSKEGETRSAGRYGVGFWSVLLFDPHRIVIESMTADGEAWARAFDGDLKRDRRLVPNIGSAGTRIRLECTINDDEDPGVLRDIENALNRYCRYLRRNNPDASHLPVYFNGVRIDRPFSIDGPCWMAFKNGSVEGVVGLGHRPKIELYARGLLVWRGTTLDELRYGARSLDDASHPEGLAPVYVLNGNNLSVTLDRRAVVDDRALARVRRIARRRMRELVGRYLDSLSPRPFSERMKDWFIGAIEDLRLGGRLIPIVGTLIITLVLALACALSVYWFFLNKDIDPTSGVTEASPDPVASGDPSKTVLVPHSDAASTLDTGDGFDGPMVEPLYKGSRLSLKYSPPEDTLFKIATAESLDAGRGIIAGPPVPAKLAPSYRCAAGCYDVETSVHAGPGILAIPVPTGHRVEPDSVWLDDQKIRPLMITGKGEPVLSLSSLVAGKLRYRTGPGTEPLDPSRWNDLLRVPSRMRLPVAYSAITSRAATAIDTDSRVEIITRFVQPTIAYDRSTTTAQAYKKFLGSSPKAGWIEFVTTLARGDCDVKNTLAIIMLRRAGVPSRLAIGIVGENGEAISGMHAWIEYHDGTWVTADATGSYPGTTPAIDPAKQSGPTPDKTMTGDRGRHSGNDRARVVALVAATVAGLAGIIALLLLLAGRGAKKINAPGGVEAMRKIAAKMLNSAIVQPEVWLRGSGLSSRRLLPVLGKQKKMSLDEATSLGRKGKLWHSSGAPSLVRRATERKARILANRDPAFGEIISRLHGIVDLDEVAALKPTRATDLPRELQRSGHLIDEVDRLIGLAGMPERTVVACRGLMGNISRDVDLRGLGLESGSRWPPWFIAVSPTDEDVRRRTALWSVDPALAAFLLLDVILARSELLRPERESIRERAALDMLRVAP